MEIRVMRILIILPLLGISGAAPTARAAEPASTVKDLVDGFLTLDELESRIGPRSRARPSPPEAETSARVDSLLLRTPALVTFAQPFTRSQAVSFTSAGPVVRTAVLGDGPLTPLISNLETARKETELLTEEITRKSQLLRNKYFFDRLTTYARTDYGTAVTGVFANGIGFGTFQQAFRQNYVTSYNLPLLQRYTKSTNWSRIFGGWAISSSVGAEPRFSQALNVQQLLNNLRLSWSVAFTYNLTGATFRKMRDGQLAEEAALTNATDRATATREELFKTMAARVEALAANPPVRDTRLESLRELYPRFELYQSRFHQAKSCEEQVEYFYTVKGLALSLLTMAGYDRRDDGERELLTVWKRARYSDCEGQPLGSNK